LFAVSGVGTLGTVFIHSAAKDGLFLLLQQYGTVMNTDTQHHISHQQCKYLHVFKETAPCNWSHKLMEEGLK
jgi:hypothetical protein